MWSESSEHITFVKSKKKKQNKTELRGKKQKKPNFPTVMYIRIIKVYPLRSILK